KGIACMIGSMMESSISVAAAAQVAAAHPNIRYFDLDAPLWLAAPPTHVKYVGETVEIS
ncbi:MAG: dipeptide epimerase, partial [Lysinibacillus sp.]